MPWWLIQWTDDAWEKIEQRGLAHADVEWVICHPDGRGVSRSSGLPIAFGISPSGEKLACVYRQIDKTTVRVVTAYRVD